MSIRIPITTFVALALASAAAAGEPAVRSGGGEHRIAAHGDSPGPAVRRLIESQIAYNRAALRAAGALATGAGGSGVDPVRLDFPLRGVAEITGPGFHGVSNFVDQDASYPDAVEDYSCGERTYDLPSGYNHPGTDYFLWPFGWRRMDLGAVEVVAAAPGVIVLKQDGHFDRSCSNAGAGEWNAVYVEHADGTVAWYGHLQNGSLTAKAVGDPVERGEYLGRVGSSGASTGPHLHFELQAPSAQVIDPYEGSCNSTTGESWWNAQPEYYDSALNEIATHSAPPVFPGCPQPEQPNYRDRFEPGETVTFAAYYRDQLAGQVGSYAVRRPDGTVFAAWEHEIPDPHYSASYWWWQHDLPAAAPTGAWSFEVEYQGTIHAHPFRVEQTVFADGFESGDTGGWSEAAGGQALRVISAVGG
jgi:hypothetical protein